MQEHGASGQVAIRSIRGCVMMDYQDYIKTREMTPISSGFEPSESHYPDAIFDHQRAIVSWACRRGRAGVFMETGLGKTITQLTWADRSEERRVGKECTEKR